MTCKGCIHKEVCYRRMDGIQETFANKCGDYLSDSVIEDMNDELDFVQPKKVVGKMISISEESFGE